MKRSRPERKTQGERSCQSYCKGAANNDKDESFPFFPALLAVLHYLRQARKRWKAG